MDTSSEQRKIKRIEDRISSIQYELIKAHEFLETGAHAHWHGFRVLFKQKYISDKVAPPHKDWVRNVFIPNRESALKDAENILDRFK